MYDWYSRLAIIEKNTGGYIIMCYNIVVLWDYTNLCIWLFSYWKAICLNVTIMCNVLLIVHFITNRIYTFCKMFRLCKSCLIHTRTSAMMFILQRENKCTEIRAKVCFHNRHFLIGTFFLFYCIFKNIVIFV